MAPFPEAEDMTVKRLYVALKRSDMQLLQMGAHKLHEKFHTGYQFEMLDDLRQILAGVEEQNIPSDIKSLLVKTINDILNGKKPEIDYVSEDSTPSTQTSNGVYSLPYTQIENKQTEQEEKYTYAPIEQKETENFVQDETEKENIVENKEGPVIFTPKEPETQTNIYQTYEQTTANQDTSANYANTIQTEQTYSNEYNQAKILEEKESTLNDVAVFYDDKAPFADFAKNKLYRMQLDMLSLEKEAHPLEDAAIVKNIVDIQTDEIGEILKMLNTIKGKVYFVTTSKSENILKTFVEYNIDFEIPFLNQDSQHKKVEILPLFGLSNIFTCPKCGKKEYFAGLHNKVLSLKCNNCTGVMYPDIYELQNLETNSNPYYWMSAASKMAKADTWILINPPLETSKTLICEFLKSAYEISKPKKVYILSKETTKKEYYKQAFKEMGFNSEIKSEYITQDTLCEDFINSEMSTIKVNV